MQQSFFVQKFVTSLLCDSRNILSACSGLWNFFSRSSPVFPSCQNRHYDKLFYNKKTPHKFVQLALQAIRGTCRGHMFIVSSVLPILLSLLSTSPLHVQYVSPVTSSPCCWHLTNVHCCEVNNATRIFGFSGWKRDSVLRVKVLWTLYSLPLFSIIHREYLFAKPDILTVVVTEIQAFLDKTPRRLVNSHSTPT